MSDDLGALLEEARALRGSLASGNSAATITINAGGIGVWLAITGCFVMLVLNIALLVFFMRTDREVSEQGHQLNAIYMMAPHLKPKEPAP